MFARSILAGLAILAATGLGLAQEVVLGDPGNNQPSSSWVSRCVSTGRADGPDCTVAQRVIDKSSGQLVASITIRIPASDKKPLIYVTAPLGLYIPAGMTLDVDGDAPQKVDLQMCDRGGCYASAALSDALLAPMRSGKALDIVFQDINKQTVKLPIPLNGFPAAYEKIQ